MAVGILTLTAGILVAGAPGPWQKSHAAVQAVGVGGAGDVFTPAALTVTAGDSVTWTWAGGTHSVTSTSAEPFDSGSLSAGSFSHTFATAGTFSYVCMWHPGMTGSITVLAAAATPAAPAAGATPAASTPGAAGAPQAAPAVLVARAGRPRLARVGVSGHKLRFRLSESATVVALAFRPHSAHGTRIGRLVASPGASTLDLRLDRLHPGHYRLVVRATDTGGQRSKATRLGYLLTHGVWQRAIDARRALAKIPAAAPVVPPATAPITPPAVAPAATGAGTVPPPPSGDDGDHSDGGGSNSSGSNSSGSNSSGSNSGSSGGSGGS